MSENTATREIIPKVSVLNEAPNSQKYKNTRPTHDKTQLCSPQYIRIIYSFKAYGRHLVDIRITFLLL